MLLVGVAIRVVITYPTHKNFADADALLSGLRAFRILDGDAVVFFSGVRLGAVESYFHALVFSIAGASRETVAIAPLAAGALTLLFFFLAVRELFGDRPAVEALSFMALPSAAYLYWTYMPNGYPETMLFCAAMLWLAARLARTGHVRDAAFLGLAAGLGAWNSLQTLSCSVPAFLWVLWRRRHTGRPLRVFALVSWFFVGAAPWILYNLRYPLASFRGSWSARPAANLLQVWSNIVDFFGYKVPELFLGSNPASGAEAPRHALQSLLEKPVALIYCASAVVLIGETLRAVRRRTRDAETATGSVLFTLVALTVFALAVLSDVGQFRGLTVRYVLPLYLVGAVSLGLLVEKLLRRTRAGAILVTLLVVAFNAAGYYWPGDAERKLWAERKQQDDQLAIALRGMRVGWIVGDYWTAYPVNFLTRRQITGIPWQRVWDYYDYRSSLRHQPGRWALVSRDPQELDRWVRQVSVPGTWNAIAPGFSAFVTSAIPPGARTGPEVAEFVQKAIESDHGVPLRK